MKNQIKKSLSLFMAVLMVLSCWVWVAPQKAEAVNTPEEGYYYVEVRGLLDDWDNDAYVLRNNWKITTANGTYTLTSNSVYNGGANDTTGNYVHASGWVYGFPTNITHEFGQTHNGKSGTDRVYNGDGWGVRNVVVYAGAQDKLAPISDANGGYKTTQAEGSYSGSQITAFKTGVAPKFAYFGTGTGTEIKLTLNTLGGADVSKGTSWSYSNYYDQYGVRWNGSADIKSFTETGTPYISKSAGGSAITGTVAEDIYYDATTGTVVAKPNLQVSDPKSQDGKTVYYLVQKFKATLANGGTKDCTASAQITVTYPKYTVKVNGAGSISGLSYTLGLSDGTTTNAEWKQESFYGASLVNMPDGTGSASGYTFKGLWSKEQPSTGVAFGEDSFNASYNAFEADFVTPISTEKFDEYAAGDAEKVKVHEIKDNNDNVTDRYMVIIGEDEEKSYYYDAGTQWSTANKTISANANYYGWWISKDLTIKFYDIDGKYLGSRSVKYGQDESAFEWPTPTESYESGAYKYNNFNGTWVDINGDTVSQSGCTFTKDLILTPKYDVSFTNKYAVKFINEADGTNLPGSADYDYRTDLANPNVIPADRPVPMGIRNDLQYSYTFEGWSTQTPSSGDYHVLLEDGDFNEAGTAIAYKTAESDWIVRSDVTYYPVYRRHLRTYAVNFWYKDSTGAEVSRKVNIKYGATLAAPTDYVPYTYASEGYGYEFKNWVYNNASGAEATFGYDKSIVFTKENITLGLGAVEDGTANVKPVGIRAAYGEPKPTPYNVTFNYKNDKGEDLDSTAEVNHGTLITSDTVNALQPAAKYDDGEAMVHFTKTWKLVEGAGKIGDAAVAEGSELSAEELLTFSPTSHVTFEAVYGNPEPFYTVTYIDGAAKFEERVLVGSNLPVWTTKVTNDNGTPDDDSDDFEEDIEYLPTKAATAQGSYEFLGWYDEQQADTTYATTNGNKYEATAKVTGNLTLYPQFKFSPYTYEIKFMSYDGKTQLAAGRYQYGQNIEMITAEANRAAQVREQDDTYTYSFIGWDKTVPTFCEGVDMVFIAQYKPVYRYYNVKWYNSVLNGENWVADKSTKTEDDKTVETGLLATTKHTYNSKLHTPSLDAFSCTAIPPEGQSYVFNGWYYNDAEGNAQPYVRGMIITGEMEFYATYKLTAKTYTVTTNVKGETEEYEVAANETAKAVPTPNAGYVNAAKHDEFKGWVTKDEYGTETTFDIDIATITADITIYAKFEESEHDYDNEELVTAPTYYAKGAKKTWCSCDAKQTENTVEIAELTDTVAPTGTIYLGTQGSWSSTDTVGAAATDGDPVTLYANANTDLILTINDTGDVNALYNPSGIGKGIGVIQGFISKGVYSQDNQNVEMSEVVKIFEDTTEKLNNTANYVIKLGDYGELEEGATYVAYYYVRDKAGNVLNTKVRTAKFIYDNSAPEFTVEGDNNADKVTGTPTYCKKATVTGIEVGATLTVNGEPATLTTTSAAGTGTYVITEAGNYLVTVTDKAGNKTSKKFKVADDHSYDTKEVLSTCTEDGYKTEICIVCGDEKDKVIYTSTGHVVSPVVYEATCLENGYILSECSHCDYSVKTEFEVDEDGEFVLDEDGKKIPVFPALGHDYDMADGEIVYTVITEATCKTKGKEIATCKVCNETITREIDIDEDAHSWGATKTLKATCTEAGKTYHTCKLCYTSEDLTTILATGHVETQWVKTTDATCGAAGVETLQCKKCKAYVDGDDEDTEIDTREIPATGRHILAVSTDPTKTYEATADKEGQITRYCTQCGQEWTEKTDKIKKYTVKFVDEDGTTEIKTIADVVSGTTVEKTAVTEPTKANSTDGKFKYTFAGWKDASGNSVSLPIDVTADITLKAAYTQSTIIYTHEFLVPNTWVQPLEATDGYDTFATMMGAMGDSRSPVAEPTFKLADEEDDEELKKLYTFKFLGWSTTGAKGDIVTDFTIAGDATFYAVFEAEAISYQVIYYNGTEYVWDTTVDGGETVTFGGETPTKAPDANKHYAFDKWYADATLKTEFDEDTEITALTRLYAGFTGTDHTWVKDAESAENKAANCTDAAVVAYKCSGCTATKTEVEGEKLGHTPEDAVTEEVDGVYYSVVYCSVCDAEISRTETSVTVAFKNHNGVRLDTQTLNVGEAIVYKGETPTKDADNKNTYEFEGWYVEGDETQEIVTLGTATVDVVYVAKFTATTRTFRVTYVDADNNTLQTKEGIKYGEAVPAFTGTNPTKKYDDFNHYTFAGWDSTVTTVTGDLVIKPVFTATKHTYVENGSADATCTDKGGKAYKCESCDHSYTGGTIPALGHDYVVERTEPDYEKGIDGKIVTTCTRCDYKNEETISSDLIPVTVTVKDSNGNPRQGVTVALVYANDISTAVAGTHNQETGADGTTTFYVAPGDYKALIEGEAHDIKVNDDRTVTGTDITDDPVQEKPSNTCSCSCHRDNFWGKLFRFFHKIIGFFSGRINCCEDPSDLY